MEILARFKKTATWAVDTNSQGLFKTGYTSGAQKQALQIPIFKLRLKYLNHVHNSSSITFKFEGDEAESVIGVLRGSGKSVYMMTETDGLEILDQLAKRTTNQHLTLYNDGWFEGVFTYKKTGHNVFLILYKKTISEHNQDIIIL